ALVTGAARGQGRSHAVALAAEGAAVVACDIAAQIGSVPYPMATKDDLDCTVELVRRSGGRCVGRVADVRDSAQVDDLVASTVADLGRLDVLVANAGICGYLRFAEIGNEAWQDMIETNLVGTFRCMRAVLPQMASQSYGRVVAISSVAGRMGSPNLAHYAASKWGVVGLVKTFALETAKLGITANVVCPASVRTPMVENEATYRVFCPELESPTLEDTMPRLAKLNPLRQPWLDPGEVSRAVLYLVTEPGYTSGAVLEVGLGSSAFRP
ncbi:MAG TPA: mycofactocin-coupled SDR family oxidoreductase, partial [Acidimicrobiales bacterium]|nr:mycofactocin-coupled SDR family oxidoreductase [Acidimicrobiales bacterium]